MKLNLNDIRIDGGTQPRAELRSDVIAEYAELMSSGVAFPPITVFFDGQHYWLADGFHRLQAARQVAGDQPIEAEVLQGTLTDAQWYSYGVNQTHGLRRTNEDKERAVRAALVHPQSRDLSDAAIAEHVGVHRKTIQRYRHKTPAVDVDCQVDLGQCPKSAGQDKGDASTVNTTDCQIDLGQCPKSAPRTGRDGRTINTAQIGKQACRRPLHPRCPSEVLAARRAGEHVKPTSQVKLELPNNHVENCAYALLEHFTFEYLQKVFEAVVHLYQQRSSQETIS